MFLVTVGSDTNRCRLALKGHSFTCTYTLWVRPGLGLPQWEIRQQGSFLISHQKETEMWPMTKACASDTATFLRRDNFNSWNASLSERFAKNIQQFFRNWEALVDWNPPKTRLNGVFQNRLGDLLIKLFACHFKALLIMIVNGQQLVLFVLYPWLRRIFLRMS